MRGGGGRVFNNIYYGHDTPCPKIVISRVHENQSVQLGDLPTIGVCHDGIQ